MLRIGLFIVCFIYLVPAWAAPKAVMIPFWNQSDESNTQTVDHAPWDQFLTRYGRPHKSGINRIRYQAVSKGDKANLRSYINRLQKISVRKLGRAEQKAFWINLYNAQTVLTILDHWPVKSIMQVNISPGWFSRGPWGAKLLTIEGKKLSLDDIEHGILRPIWKDPLVHYAVNCASLGCPNLALRAYSKTNIAEMLLTAAKSYINHPRGARVEKGKLMVSSIYKWFATDFGNNDAAIIQHLRQFASEPLKKSLQGIKSIDSYGYDWSINAIN